MRWHSENEIWEKDEDVVVVGGREGDEDGRRKKEVVEIEMPVS